MNAGLIFPKSSRHLLRWASDGFSGIKTFTSLSTAFSALNHVDISSLLSACGKEGHLRLCSYLHAAILKSPCYNNHNGDRNVGNIIAVWNSLLSVYVQCGKVGAAAKLFDEMPIRDTVSWNSIIYGFLRNREYSTGFGYFKEMLRLGFHRFDRASLTTILSACDGLDFLGITKMVHGLVVLSGYERETAVGNALITSYFRCGCFDSGKRAFDELMERNVISWTATISGLVQNEFLQKSLSLFKEMCRGSVRPNILTYLSALCACAGWKSLKVGCQIHGLLWKLGFQSNYRVETALMDMYSKCGNLEDAWEIFESAKMTDEISMTVLLLGFAQNGFEDEAIQIFLTMVKQGSEIDPDVVSAVLGVFGADTSLDLGKQVHCMVTKKAFGANAFVSNGLINMYSKCGSLEESAKIFYGMRWKNQVSWNSMIAAFARHGDGFKAFQLYDEMKAEGIQPTDVTFLSLLHASSHVGLVHKGIEFLETMQQVYGMKPRLEHYACMVDMLGRAGLLQEAKSFIEELPVRPGALVWQALLGACSIHGDTELGKFAADQLCLFAPDTSVPVPLMANLYSSRGKWKDRERVIRVMRRRRVPKESGLSRIETEKS